MAFIESMGIYFRCKIADFGLARSVSQSQSGRENDEVELCLTDYVATRWYRAPELLVASKKYVVFLNDYLVCEM